MPMTQQSQAMFRSRAVSLAALFLLCSACLGLAQTRALDLAVEGPNYPNSPFGPAWPEGDPRARALYPGEPFFVGIVALWAPVSSNGTGPPLTADLLRFTVLPGCVDHDRWPWMTAEDRPSPVAMAWQVEPFDPSPTLALGVTASAAKASELPPGEYTVLISLDGAALPEGLPPEFNRQAPILTSLCFVVTPATDDDRLWLIYREIIHAEGFYDFGAAEEACLRLLAQYPTSVLTLIKLGEAREKRGNVEGARTAWTEAMRVIAQRLDTRTPSVVGDPKFAQRALKSLESRLYRLGKNLPVVGGCGNED